MKKYFLTVLLILVVFVFSSFAQGSNFPEKEIVLLVPWGAGGITDLTARTFAPCFEKNIGKPVVIVNRPGASGAIGTEEAYSQAADGYTVLLSAETLGTFQVMDISERSFADFEPLIMMISSLKVIVVPANSSYKTIFDLIEDIKKRPGEVRMSYSGPGASGHIQGLLLTEAGLNVSMTPFGGGHSAMVATLGGQVEFTFSNYVTAIDYIKNGDLRVLAVFEDERVDYLSEVPTLTEALPELKPYFPLYFPNCLLVKKGTPENVKEILLKAAEAAVKEERWIEFTDQNYYNRLHDIKGEEFTNYWNKWRSIVCWLSYDAGVAKYSPEKFGIPRLQF